MRAGRAKSAATFIGTKPSTRSLLRWHSIREACFLCLSEVLHYIFVALLQHLCANLVTHTRNFLHWYLLVPATEFPSHISGFLRYELFVTTLTTNSED